MNTYKLPQKRLAKKFLEVAQAELIYQETFEDSHIRRVYEIQNDGMIEVWIERESLPNCSTPYSLKLYTGENE